MSFVIASKDSKGYFIKEELEKMSDENILENFMLNGYSQNLCNLIRLEYLKIMDNENSKIYNKCEEDY